MKKSPGAEERKNKGVLREIEQEFNPMTAGEERPGENYGAGDAEYSAKLYVVAAGGEKGPPVMLTENYIQPIQEAKKLKGEFVPAILAVQAERELSASKTSNPNEGRKFLGCEFSTEFSPVSGERIIKMNYYAAPATAEDTEGWNVVDVEESTVSKLLPGQIRELPGHATAIERLSVAGKKYFVVEHVYEEHDEDTCVINTDHFVVEIGTKPYDPMEGA